MGQYQDENKENCLVCDNKLEYLDLGKEFICYRCGKSEVGYVNCTNNHYICYDCHGKSTSELIFKLSLEAAASNPLIIAENMLLKTNVPMLGCEHALITVGSLLAAIKNHGEIAITNEQIKDAFERTKKQAIAAYCGLTGICGIAPAIGASFSVILGAACPKDKETAATMHVVASIIKTIANEAGPCCCKNFMRKALYKSCELAKEYLGIVLSHDIAIECADFERHPHGCRREKCSYYNM